jgi:thiol-disulfide isomerase/thioredoxin
MKVIKIGAVWCNSCLVMKPRWKEIEAELPWLDTEYYDYDQDHEKIEELGVKEGRLPVFIFLDENGEEFKRMHGEHPKDELIKIIQENKER